MGLMSTQSTVTAPETAPSLPRQRSGRVHSSTHLCRPQLCCQQCWEAQAEGWEEQIHFLPGFCFLRIRLDSKHALTNTQAWSCSDYESSHVAHLQQHSQWQRTNLKVLCSLQTESLQWGVRGPVTDVSSSPLCTHSTQLWSLWCQWIESHF